MRGEKVQKNLIPIYREKEIYTIVYDTEQNKLYRFSHRKLGSSLTYMGLFFLFLYGSKMLNGIYQHYRNPLLDLFLFVVLLISCFVISKVLMNQFYFQRMEHHEFYNKDNMKHIADMGRKQLRRELILGLGLCLFLSLIGLVLFVMIRQIEPLIVFGLGLVPIYIILLTRPFTRNVIFKKFQRKEIDL